MTLGLHFDTKRMEKRDTQKNITKEQLLQQSNEYVTKALIYNVLSHNELLTLQTRKSAYRIQYPQHGIVVSTDWRDASVPQPRGFNSWSR